MTAWRILTACALAALGCEPSHDAAGGDGLQAAGQAQWTEVAWPYPLDPWEAGRAFSCPASLCGHEVHLALRPKIGFCNCTTGVADDEEVDRVSDLPVLSDRYAPDGAGWPIGVGPMVGRARRYTVLEFANRKRFAIAVAASRRCDVVVALMDSDGPLSPDIERAGLTFLGSAPLLDWVGRRLGG